MALNCGFCAQNLSRARSTCPVSHRELPIAFSPSPHVTPTGRAARKWSSLGLLVRPSAKNPEATGGQRCQSSFDCRDLLVGLCHHHIWRRRPGELCVCVDFGCFGLAADRLRPAIGNCSARWRFLRMNCTHPPGAEIHPRRPILLRQRAGEGAEREGEGEDRRVFEYERALPFQKEKGVKSEKTKNKSRRRGGGVELRSALRILKPPFHPPPSSILRRSLPFTRDLGTPRAVFSICIALHCTALH